MMSNLKSFAVARDFIIVNALRENIYWERGCKSEYSMTARWNFVAYIMNLIKIECAISWWAHHHQYDFTYWIWKCRQICVIKISALIFDRVKLIFSVHHYSWVMHCPYWTIIDLHRSSKKSTSVLTWPLFKMPLLSARLDSFMRNIWRDDIFC